MFVDEELNNEYALNNPRHPRHFGHDGIRIVWNGPEILSMWINYGHSGYPGHDCRLYTTYQDMLADVFWYLTTEQAIQDAHDRHLDAEGR